MTSYHLVYFVILCYTLLYFANPMNLLIKKLICEFRPGNKTVYVVFDEESDVLGPRR